MSRVLKCRYPFPAQDPPVTMPESCAGRCPNAEPRILWQHARIKRDDQELLAALWSFARWFYDEPDDQIAEQVGYAAELYTRRNHEGTCIPKTLLFAHYKLLQLDPYAATLKLTDVARAAIRGQEVPSWPDGESASCPAWNQMFAGYGARYE